MLAQLKTRSTPRLNFLYPSIPLMAMVVKFLLLARTLAPNSQDEFVLE